jgi:hypothetical protein
MVWRGFDAMKTTTIAILFFVLSLITFFAKPFFNNKTHPQTQSYYLLCSKGSFETFFQTALVAKLPLLHSR